MLAAIVKLLRVASFVVCAIVILSFGAFVVEQSKGASEHQQNELESRPRASTKTPGAQNTGEGSHPSSAHKALDEASTQLVSPFAGVVSGSNSEWLTRGVELLLALAVYGFGVSYLASVLRVRV